MEETRLYAHGQGYDLVERPSFQKGETMKIKAGMNIAPHPAILTKEATAIVCDNYIVTETGVSECLHKIPKEIFVVSWPGTVGNVSVPPDEAQGEQALYR